MSEKAERLRFITRLATEKEQKSASKIQTAFRNHQARLRLKNQAAWTLHEKLEYSSEQTESKLQELFERLLQSSDKLSPSVNKILRQAGIPVEERELLSLTNPERVTVESTYRGPRIDGPITRKTLVDLIEAFQHGEILHEKYVCEILHQARSILKTVPNFNHIDLSTLKHLFVIGDLHGQLADLLHIFNSNGLPATDNPYIFNGDFVDRGSHSIEVLLILLVCLILYPSSVFLNRGNHEDIMVTVRYGFQKEVNRKYPKRQTPILDLFKDIFSWLPLYSYVDGGKFKFLIIHGGISDRVNLKHLNDLKRNKYVSVEVAPASKTGGKFLTDEEENEFRQVQDIFWSDPDPRGRNGCRKNEDRKVACFFGPDITEQFLKKYNLSMIVRSHQVKQDGYEFTQNGKVLTLFSASNYSNGSNWGAIARWDFNEPDPWLIAFKTQPIEMEKLSFSKKVTLFEDPVYQSLTEKLVSNKTILMERFKAADPKKTNHVSPTAWASIVSEIVQLDLPWLTLRSKLVEEDEKGILYLTMFESYALDNSKMQLNDPGIMEDLYQKKDMLMVLFNLIDFNHSGFISRNEFSDVVKLLLNDEKNPGTLSDAYIDELASAMDIDKNGKIDVNEFLESFRIVSVKKKPDSSKQDQTKKTAHF